MNLFNKAFKGDGVLGYSLAAVFVVMLVAGFFIFKSVPAAADETVQISPIVDLAAEVTPQHGTSDMDATAHVAEEVSTRTCDVVIPAGSSWDFEALKAKAAKFGCQVNQFFSFDDEAEVVEIDPANTI